MKNDDLSLRYGRSKSNSKNDIVINPSILVNTISKSNLNHDEVMIGTVVHEAIHATKNYTLDTASLNNLFPDELDDVEDIEDILEILTGPFGKYVFDILIHSIEERIFVKQYEGLNSILEDIYEESFSEVKNLTNQFHRAVKDESHRAGARQLYETHVITTEDVAVKLADLRRALTRIAPESPKRRLHLAPPTSDARSIESTRIDVREVIAHAPEPGSRDPRQRARGPLRLQPLFTTQGNHRERERQRAPRGEPNEERDSIEFPPVSAHRFERVSASRVPVSRCDDSLGDATR